VLVCVAALFHFTSFQLLLATMPLYVIQHLGGHNSDVGLLMGIVALTALAMRPVSGWAVEALGRRKVMMFGPFAFAVASAAYPFAPNIPLLMGLRCVHGLGIGAYATGSSVYVGDLAPPARRGEALGYYGIAQNLSQAIGPAAGLFIYEIFDFHGLFAAAAGMALVALAITFQLRDLHTPVPSRRPAINMFFNVKVLRPAVLVVGMAFATGSVMAFVPLYGRDQGVSNPGFFFTIYAISMLLSRPIAGTLSDRMGRIAVAAPGLGVIAAGLGVLAFSGQWWALIVSAVLLGLGIGTVQPALMALMIDMTTVHERGGAMSTFGIGMDAGIGIGSIVLGMVIESYGYGPAFGLAAILPLVLLAIYGLAQKLWPIPRSAAQAGGAPSR
jgi:MFS family permease